MTPWESWEFIMFAVCVAVALVLFVDLGIAWIVRRVNEVRTMRALRRWTK